MSISLGDLTLDPHISWSNFATFNPVFSSQETTLGGVLVLTELLAEFQEIILEAIEEDNIRKGFFTHAQIEALKVLRNNRTKFTFTYHSTVVTNARVAPDGINVQKVLWKSVLEDADKYIGIVKLIA